MNLELVKTFVAVLRLGGMRRAAESLHVTQPAVSARIRQLENQLGVRLFERVGRRLVPTESGRLLAQDCGTLLAAEEALLQRLEQLRTLRSGTLHLSTIDAASIYVLPEVYLEFRQAFPGIDLNVQVVETRKVLAAVRDLDVEIGFLALPVSHPQMELHPGVEVVPIYEDRMVCVASPTHPLASRRSLRLASIAAHPLVLYDRGSTTRALLDTVFSARGLTPNVAMETASPEAMKRLAEVGVGIAILPEAQVRAEIADGRLRRLVPRDARFKRRLGSAVRAGRQLGKAAQRFLDLVYRRWPPLAARNTQRAARRARS
ncbi:MAG: LysR family transcriptional regulator [Candidatus Krumholzibacteriia bacterium]